ncbi:acyltransferase [Providencia rettgeri]
MTGKEKFKKFNFIIKISVKLVSLLPRSLRVFLYNIFMSMPSIMGVAIRYILVKTLINQCGDNIYISRWVTIKNFERINIGNNVSIHEYSYIDGLGYIDIGDNVSIAHNSSLISFEHTFEQKTPIKYQKLLLKKISISDDVWIGCGCRILSGASIHRHTVIGANSIVKNIISSDSLYAGSPAKKIKGI